MHPILRKLRLKPEHTSLVLNAPASIHPILDGTGYDIDPGGEGAYDFVLLFTSNKSQVDELGPLAVRSGRHDAIIWMAYPKGSSGVTTDINRDRGWDVVNALGLRPVAVVSLDDTWSALRFRPAELVK